MEELRLRDYALNIEEKSQEVPCQNDELVFEEAGSRETNTFWSQCVCGHNVGKPTSPVTFFGTNSTQLFGQKTSNCNSETPNFGSKLTAFETESPFGGTSKQNKTQCFESGRTFGSILAAAAVGTSCPQQQVPKFPSSGIKVIPSSSTEKSADKTKTADLLVAKIKSENTITVGSTGSFKVTHDADKTMTNAAPGLEFKLVPGDECSKDIVVSSSLPDDFIIAFYGFGK